MEILNLSLFSSGLHNFITKKIKTHTGGGELNNLPDPPEIPGMENFQSIIKTFILFSAIAFVVFFFPIIVFALL